MNKIKITALNELRDDGGHIEPTDVIAAARSSNHPLHSEFEWNIKKAAARQWLETARELIREYKIAVIVEDIEVTAVGYVVDPNRPTKSRRYIDLTVAAKNTETSKQILLSELERIIAAIRRAKEIALVLGMKSHFDLLLRDVQNIEARTKKVGPRKPKSREPKSRRRPSQPPEMRV